MAVALVVHGPDVEAEGGEVVHHRVVGTARHLQVVAAAAGEGRAVHQEQHRLGRVAVPDRAFAVEVEIDAALLGPVLLGGDGVALGGGRARNEGGGGCGNGGGARCLHDLAPTEVRHRQRRSSCHGGSSGNCGEFSDVYTSVCSSYHISRSLGAK